ncbi:HPr kinase/phosphorylase [Falsihalocynthiibacter sp. SS001]|uniref:HPr kinase/phosphorylase n=1 Tax=Falsihalocynthiibacter sp. SS001 TaxID=3349698 RepID=UPI0036D40D6F
METCRVLHATAVDVDGKAAVIFGPSGSGKSTLALRMISLGARLVGDDRVQLESVRGVLKVFPVATIAGRLEVRNVGIINAPNVCESTVGLMVDMETEEQDRLPPFREISILGQKAPLYHRVKGDHFADALTQILKYGRSD